MYNSSGITDGLDFSNFAVVPINERSTPVELPVIWRTVTCQRAGYHRSIADIKQLIEHLRIKAAQTLSIMR